MGADGHLVRERPTEVHLGLDELAVADVRISVIEGARTRTPTPTPADARQDAHAHAVRPRTRTLSRMPTCSWHRPAVGAVG
jgi:hypothetical protein